MGETTVKYFMPNWGWIDVDFQEYNAYDTDQWTVMGATMRVIRWDKDPSCVGRYEFYPADGWEHDCTLPPMLDYIYLPLLNQPSTPDEIHANERRCDELAYVWWSQYLQAELDRLKESLVDLWDMETCGYESWKVLKRIEKAVPVGEIKQVLDSRKLADERQNKTDNIADIF